MYMQTSGASHVNLAKLVLFQETVDHGSMEASVKLQKKGISINDCIELFTSANKLGDDDLR